MNAMESMKFALQQVCVSARVASVGMEMEHVLLKVSVEVIPIVLVIFDRYS
jgi:hypothetical protein